MTVVYVNLVVIFLKLRNCVTELFREWREMGSVQNKKKNRRKTVLTEQNLADIQARIQRSARKSSRRLA